MTKDFFHRFNITVDVEAARLRFLNRVLNILFDDFLWRLLNGDETFALKRAVASSLGERLESHRNTTSYFEGDFNRTLIAVEAAYAFIRRDGYRRGQFEGHMQNLMDTCENDIGVRWKEGKFYPAGAKELDNRLVNDVLDWLKEPELAEVRAALVKALEHLSSSVSNPALRKDVITDTYEALESLSKVTIGRDKDLSGNRELFLAKINAPSESRDLLKAYIDFGCEYRHGTKEATRPVPSEADTEMFLYLTGALIRRAVRARQGR